MRKLCYSRTTAADHILIHILIRFVFGTDSGHFVQFRGAACPRTPNIHFSSCRILRLSIIKCYILINNLKIKCDFLPCSCRDESLMFVLKEAVSSQTQTAKSNFDFVPGLLASADKSTGMIRFRPENICRRDHAYWRGF